jgi:hypothetical protein
VNAPAQKLTSEVQPAQMGQVIPATQSTAGSQTPVAPPSATPAPESPIVARINGQDITRDDFLKPLIEAHGLQILMGLVQLDMAKYECNAAHLTVTPGDIRREEDLSLEKMFKDSDTKEQDLLFDVERKGDTAEAEKIRKQIHEDREALLSQYLEKQNFSRTEFMLKMEINTYLHKLAQKELAGKVTDEMVEKEFGIEFGETAEVSFIQVANNLDAVEAMRRIKSGEDFAKVAREMSQNKRNAELGGKMDAFSRATPGIPDAFKQLAFSLQEGQIGDVLNLGNFYFIVRLDKKYPPKAVKFENVKDTLRRSMYERLESARMEQVSNAIAQAAAARTQIVDPVLQDEYKKYKAQQQSAQKDQEKMRLDWEKGRTPPSTLEQRIAAIQAANTRPAATEPTAGGAAANAPASAPAAAAAPATQP